jgi:PPP family 3-phenylpropionic acid transporter
MARIRLLFVLNGAAFAVFAPFASVILAERGFSVAEIGLLAALASAGYVLAVSAWGHLGDVVLGRARALRFAMLLSAALMIAFQLPLPPLAVGVAYVAYSACFGAGGPLSDALAVNGMRDPGRQYGPVRALASAAFTVTTIAVGLFYGAVGYWPAGLLFVGVALLVAWLAGRLPDVGRATLSGHRRGGAIREALTIQPALVKLLVAVGIAYVGIFAGFTFLSLRLVELGAGAPEVAVSSAVAAGAEIGAMIIAGRIIGRTGIRLLFVVSALLSAVAFAAWAVLASPEAIIATRIVSGFGYSGLWIASVMTIQLLLPPRLQGSGQGLIAMTTAGLAAFVANVIGGIIYASLGHGALFGVGAAFAVVGAALGWLWMPPRGAKRFAEPVSALGDAGQAAAPPVANA